MLVRIVVQEWERVLLYRDGRFAQVLGPGRHRRARWRRRRVHVVVRPRLQLRTLQAVEAGGTTVHLSTAPAG